MDWLIALWNLLVHYWPALLGVGLPFAVAVIARCDWSGEAKSWTAFGLSVALGVLAPFIAGLAFVPANIVAIATAAFTVCTLAYAAFKRVGITSKWLDALLEIGSLTGDRYGT